MDTTSPSYGEYPSPILGGGTNLIHSVVGVRNLPMSTQTKCRSKNPATCRVHGTPAVSFTSVFTERAASHQADTENLLFSLHEAVTAQSIRNKFADAFADLTVNDGFADDYSGIQKYANEAVLTASGKEVIDSLYNEATESYLELKQKLIHTTMSPEYRTSKLENAKLALGVYRRALFAARDTKIPPSTSNDYKVVYDNGVGGKEVVYTTNLEDAIRTQKALELRLGGHDDAIGSEIARWDDESKSNEELITRAGDGGLKITLGFGNEIAYLISS
jgi:hypothetical protein